MHFLQPVLALALCSVLFLSACAGLHGDAKNAQGEPVFFSQQNPTPMPAPLYEGTAQEQADPPLLVRTLALFRPATRTPSAVREQLQALAGTAGPYRMGAGDVLDIAISGLGQTPDVRLQRALDAQGTLDLDDLGAYRLQGLTPAQAQRALRSALETDLHTPQVEVRVAQYRSQSVRLQGAVYAPGDYFIDAAPMSLAEAITRAGGLLQEADLSRIELQRAGQATQTLDLQQLYGLGLPPENLMLRSGDTLNFVAKP